MPAQTAPFALAFVAGYATDIFFAVADRLVDELYHLAKGKDKDAKDVKAAADGIQAEPGASGPAPNAPSAAGSPAASRQATAGTPPCRRTPVRSMVQQAADSGHFRHYLVST